MRNLPVGFLSLSCCEWSVLNLVSSMPSTFLSSFLRKNGKIKISSKFFVVVYFFLFVKFGDLFLPATLTRTRELYPHPHPRPLPASRDPRHLDILSRRGVMLIYLYDKRSLINVHSENCIKKVKKLNFFSTTLMQYRNAEFYLSLNKNRNETCS